MRSPSQTLLDHLRRLTRLPAGDAALLARWVRERHEDAFAALVARHGPMVFGVCRRILGDGPDAEDVFQAVFLILARKAASLRRPEALAGWLHGVAARLAWKARAARRREAHSRPLAVEPADVRPDPLDLVTVREMLALFDQEIGELPEVYRLPVVLCDLEGRTQEEAAEMLGWTLGSLRGRLLRGRARLKARWVRRGLTLPVGVVLPLIPATLAASSQAAVPVLAPQTIAATSRCAVRFAAHPATVEVPARVAALARDGLRVLMLGKVKIAAAMIVMLSVCLAGAGLMALRMREAKPAEERREDTPPSANITPKPAEENMRARLDRFGDLLPEGAVARMGTVRFRHGRVVHSVAFSPDGKTLASGGGDNTARLWEIATGKELRRFTAATGPGTEYADVDKVAFSPDGKLLAAGTGNGPGEVVIWDLAAGKESRLVRDNLRSVTSIAFSPDSKTLATGTNTPAPGVVDALIHLWDASTGKSLRQLKGHRDGIASLAFSPDGKTLASASGDKTIRLWDPTTGRERGQLKGHTDKVLAIAFARDGKTLASGSEDHTIRLWDTAAGKELCLLKGRSSPTSTLAFLPDGKMLASGDWNGVIRLWDTATGKELSQLKEPQGSISAIAVSPDGKMLASSGSGPSDSTVRLWDVAKGEELRPTTQGHEKWLWAVALSPDGKQAATGGDDGAVRLWEADTGKEIRRLHYSTLPSLVRNYLIDRIYFSPDGKTLSATTWGYSLYRWETATGKVLHHRSYDAINVPRATPDGKYVVGSDGHGIIHLVDALTGQEVQQFKTPRNSAAAELSPDGKFLAAKASENEVVIWELATGKERCRCKGRVPAGSCPTLAFSPDSQYLAAAIETNSRRSPILLWDEGTGREVRQFLGHDHVLCLAFSPDGRTLASGGLKTIRLWETATGKERHDLTGHQGYIRSLAFSPDGTRLVSVSDDTTGLVWDVTGLEQPGRAQGGKLSAKQLQALWTDLAGDDAAKAYHAIWLLARHPKQSVSLLREHVPPAHVLDAEMRKRVERWLAELDSDEAAVRNHANAELEKRIVTVEAMLRKALTRQPSLEQRKRIERLLERLEHERVTLGRALEALENAAAPESRQLLETLAAGEPEAWLTREAKAALRRVQARQRRQ